MVNKQKGIPNSKTVTVTDDNTLGTTLGGATTGDTVLTTYPGTTKPYGNTDQVYLGGNGGGWATPDQVVEMDMSDLVELLQHENNIEHILAAYARAVVVKTLGKGNGLGNALDILGIELATGWEMYPIHYASRNGRMYSNGNFKIYVKVQG